ncbi:MAG: HD domain-containing phosphohydrolase [Eubacteriales bacterium]|jgi:response regulator RpfG family c-di-GMP phosphodiesterase
MFLILFVFLEVIKIHTSRLGRIIIIDDEQDLTTALCDMLTGLGYEALGFTSGDKALEVFKEQKFDVVIIDLAMPEMDGAKLLKRFLAIDKDSTCILLTGQSMVSTAADCMKKGAFDYIIKPFKLNSLLLPLAHAMEIRNLRQENQRLREELAVSDMCKVVSADGEPDLILNRLADAVYERFGAGEVSILLPSESGDEFYVAATRGKNRQSLLGSRIPLNKAAAGLVPNLLDETNNRRLRLVQPQAEAGSTISLPLLSKGHLTGTLNVTSSDRKPFSPGQIKALGMLARTAENALEKARLLIENKQTKKESQITLQKIKILLEETIIALSNTVEARDQYIVGHQLRVAELSSAIAILMNLPEKQKEGLRIASILHDTGKIYIPLDILAKPGMLNENEYNLIKNHPLTGLDILKNISFIWPVSQIILQHHERVDGSGYPFNLPGENILQEAKILSVADVVEAMSASRPYRPALGIEAALKEISEKRGTLYDSEVVDACLELFHKKGFQFKFRVSLSS